MDSDQMSLERMLKHQIIARGIDNPRVLEAMRAVPRHLFVPESLRDQAYEDYPLPIGYGQTISQPYIVALMTDILKLEKHHKVLEIGTGSGYQSAILSLLASRVITIEHKETLWKKAKDRLNSYPNILCIYGNGYEGYPLEAPYDRILLTAAPPNIPQALLDQLTPKGILVAPVGEFHQKLVRITKEQNNQLHEEYICDVIFVPMIPEKE
ncbi:protein-L-isoaspartate(D-aspartate) O-methyltransferase [Thermospira aquatica]|uniref:Protein-L-isoaspartate O-methyltransferase n=1 Tax=Thermospira aquatica TaxID=2828656 RepID=A0AAX3BE51_9SPIR|nr:protein-L-isoaspartate(D-aspartate) O-methyltransferase [Thermospira aquatica]URA10428.1 protein-L-isoaspartate(D-aspartate) O-methyltransferase [Thermospira aquatica]